MIQRRSFLKTASLATVASFALPNLLSAEKLSSVGLQLYTLRERMAKDPEGTLREVSKLGFKYVEGYTNEKGMFFGYKPKEFKELLAKLGLTMPSTHISYEDEHYKPETSTPTLTQDSEKLFKMASEAGLKYVTCPWLVDKYRTEDGFKIAAQALTRVGKQAKEFGLNVGYHNHDFEFKTVGTKTGYQLLLENSDPEYLKFEMDLFWVEKAGFKPLELFAANPGRFYAWHVKDMAADKTMTEVGSGTIDFKAIFQKAKEAGTKYFFVEQDKCPADPLLSVEKSMDYIKNRFNY